MRWAWSELGGQAGRAGLAADADGGAVELADPDGGVLSRGGGQFEPLAVFEQQELVRPVHSMRPERAEVMISRPSGRMSAMKTLRPSLPSELSRSMKKTRWPPPADSMNWARTDALEVAALLVADAQQFGLLVGPGPGEGDHERDGQPDRPGKARSTGQEAGQARPAANQMNIRCRHTCATASRRWRRTARS